MSATFFSDLSGYAAMIPAGNRGRCWKMVPNRDCERYGDLWLAIFCWVDFTRFLRLEP